MIDHVETNNGGTCSRTPLGMKRLMKRSFSSLAVFSFMTAGLMLAGCGDSDDNDFIVLPAKPTAPLNVTAVGGTGQATLTWAPVSTATSYNAYYSTTSGVTTTTGTKVSNVSTPAVQGNLTPATPYYFVITAVNAGGESAPSAQATATTLATPATTLPAVPSGVTTTGGAQLATITWPAVTGATSYNIYRSTTPGVTTTTGTKITGVTSPYVNTGLASDTTYYYIVTAVNSVGETAASAEKRITTTAGQPTGLPAVPAGVTAVGGANQVSLAWPAVTGATAYNVYWSTTPGVTTATGTKIPASTNSHVQTGLTAGTTYYYVVSAVNGSGEGSASTQMSATPTTAAPQACGSCHAIPPALGSHAAHTFTSCATCHGAGYSTTTVNTALHNNGTKDVTTSIWIPATRSCAASCHVARPW